MNDAQRGARILTVLTVLALLAFAAAALVGLCRCAAPTQEARDSRRIGSLLLACMREANRRPMQLQSCSHASAAMCLEAGLPRDCGHVSLWWQTATDTGLPPFLPPPDET